MAYGPDNFYLSLSSARTVISYSTTQQPVVPLTTLIDSGKGLVISFLLPSVLFFPLSISFLSTLHLFLKLHMLPSFFLLSSLPPFLPPSLHPSLPPSLPLTKHREDVHLR